MGDLRKEFFIMDKVHESVSYLFCSTSDTALAEANSPVATFARCSPYSSSLVIICKNGLHFAIRYPPLRFQA